MRVKKHKNQQSLISLGIALLATPAIAIFLSSNLVNVGNLAFNVLFSRWMGPEAFGDLSLILTIKLSLFAILGALQMAVTKDVAQNPSQKSLERYAWANRLVFAAMWCASPIILAAVWASDLGVLLGLRTPNAILILVISLPFLAPLHLLRGVGFAMQNTGALILSANVEMLVRLFGAVVVWHLGFGIAGVVFAVGLSCAAGWVTIRSVLPNARGAVPGIRPLVKTIAVAASPFAMLQLAQIFSLDGSIFLAKAFLSDHQAGLLAALSLFQRIEFFACFTLAAVLLPGVINAVKSGHSIRTPVRPVAILFLTVTLSILAGILCAPDLMIHVLVGSAYEDAKAGLIPAAITAICFTFSYLTASVLIALEDWFGAKMALAGSIIQLTLLALPFARHSLTALLWTEATVHILLASIVFGYTLAKVINPTTEQRITA